MQSTGLAIRARWGRSSAVRTEGANSVGRVSVELEIANNDDLGAAPGTAPGGPGAAGNDPGRRRFGSDEVGPAGGRREAAGFAAGRFDQGSLCRRPSGQAPGSGGSLRPAPWSSRNLPRRCRAKTDDCARRSNRARRPGFARRLCSPASGSPRSARRNILRRVIERHGLRFDRSRVECRRYADFSGANPDA